MKRKFTGYIVILILVLSVFTGCSYSVGMVSSTKKGKMDYSYTTFNGEESHSEKLKEGQTLALDYSITVKKGKLIISVSDPDGKEVLKKEFTESKKDKIDIAAEKTGKYIIYVKGEDTSGGCHIKLSTN
jgi:hypothetical protein